MRHNSGRKHHLLAPFDKPIRRTGEAFGKAYFTPTGRDGNLLFAPPACREKRYFRVLLTLLCLLFALTMSRFGVPQIVI